MSISLLFVFVSLLFVRIGISQRPFHYFFPFRHFLFPFCYFLFPFYYYWFKVAYLNVRFVSFCSGSSLFVSGSLLFAPFRHLLLHFVTFCTLDGPLFKVSFSGFVDTPVMCIIFYNCNFFYFFFEGFPYYCTAREECLDFLTDRH